MDIHKAHDCVTSDAAYILRQHNLAQVEGINAAIKEMADAMPNYKPPLFHGSGFLSASGDAFFEVFNSSGHDFPAMLLAAICGYQSGTQVISLSEKQLQLALSLMGPAEECKNFQHPNVAAWRRILKRIYDNPGEQSIIVFIADLQDSGTNTIIDSFLKQMNERQG